MEGLKTVMDILDKVKFFQGQRAGRELWNDKPVEVQEEDLENFKRDINTIRSYIWKVVKELKQYRDAEEQGLLLRLPCKVGDVLWWIDAFGDLCSSEVNSMFIEQGIDGIVIETWICNINGKEIGKTAFLTKEEAEQALAKMKDV